MKVQNKIIVSIGSNQGNRLTNLQRSVNLIHERIGTVIQVSSVYETPAWGFDSSPFLNGALELHSFNNAEDVLTQLLTIEVELGRVRSEGAGYQARIIDLDIVAFNETIVDTERLKIPHPQIQNRKFVLEPLQEIKPEWMHPVLKQSVSDLLASTDDDSNCVVVGQLENPLESFGLKQFNYIAIEGNIGVGKTTLAKRIAEDFNAKLVLERFADNPFLPKFYKDQNRYAFPLEMSFLAERYQQLSDDLAQYDLFKDFIVTDYHAFKSLVFAKVTLNEEEYHLYKTMFDIVHKEMPKPDLYVYLYQNTDRLLENIKTRGRSYEQEIQATYLDKINSSYLEFIKNRTDLNVLTVDVSELDFVNKQSDYIHLLRTISGEL